MAINMPRPWKLRPSNPTRPLMINHTARSDMPMLLVNAIGSLAFVMG
jgi:hypothetical protein